MPSLTPSLSPLLLMSLLHVSSPTEVEEEEPPTLPLPSLLSSNSNSISTTRTRDVVMVIDEAVKTGVTIGTAVTTTQDSSISRVDREAEVAA